MKLTRPALSLRATRSCVVELRRTVAPATGEPVSASKSSITTRSSACAEAARVARSKRKNPDLIRGRGESTRERREGHLSFEGFRVSAQAGLLTSGISSRFPSRSKGLFQARHPDQWELRISKRQRGSAQRRTPLRPVTVAGPRQIYTAFPILPKLGTSFRHLCRYVVEDGNSRHSSPRSVRRRTRSSQRGSPIRRNAAGSGGPMPPVNLTRAAGARHSRHLPR